MSSFPAQIPLILVLLAALASLSCSPRISLFSSREDPLAESVLQGEGQGKVLVLPIQGFISDQPRQGLLSSRPSMVQEVVARLHKAEKDPEIKGLVLTINSPGGTTTASDILYHEITAFKERTGIAVTACLMDTAASGGYYAALAADRIIIHPTTVTGSVGVIFLLPKAYGLMDKVGVSVDVTKSGRNKDMGSPMRPATPEEQAIMQSIIDSMAERFWSLVATRRHPSPEAMERVKTARIFDADEALRLGLVDQKGYLSDALRETKKTAGLQEDARVVAYRRTDPPDDTPYNSPASTSQAALVSLGIEQFIPTLKAGCYYLWLP